MILKLRLTALLATALIFNACKKEEDKKPVPVYQFSVTAKVDNQPFTAVQAGSNKVLGGFFFDAADSQGNFIKFHGQKLTHVGAYPNMVGQYLMNDDGMNPTLYSTDFGGRTTFVITKLDTIDHRISGTFTFESEKYSGNGKDSVFVTEGVFTDVRYL